MKKKILIAGVHGFLGKSLWEYIRKNYPQVELYGIARRGRGTKNVFVCDLKQEAKLAKIILAVKPDYIFNMTGGRYASEEKLLEANFYATLSLLKVVQQLRRQKGVQSRIVIPGTAAEYGSADNPRTKITEQTPVQPISLYGFVKLLQTQASMLYARQGLDIIVVRMFNILGQGLPPTLSLGKFSQDIVLIEKGLKKPVLVTGNLDGQRDFLDIEDVCSALLKVAQKGSRGQIYNICSGRLHSMRSLLKMLCGLSSIRNIVIKEEQRDVSKSCDVAGSSIKLKKLTHWQPRVSINASLKKTLDHYRGTTSSL